MKKLLSLLLLAVSLVLSYGCGTTIGVVERIENSHHNRIYPATALDAMYFRVSLSDRWRWEERTFIDDCAPYLILLDIPVSLTTDTILLPYDLYCVATYKTPLDEVTSLVQLKELLEDGADPNKDYRCSIPLMKASRENNFEMVKLLVQYGADVNIKDDNESTALMLTYNYDIAKLLIDNGADIKVIGSDGSTALMFCRNYDIAVLLIDKGEDVNARKKDGTTVLMVFSSPFTSHNMIAKLLVEKGADVNAKNNYGETALMYANTYQIAKLLIENGADVKAVDNNGNTALMFCRYYKTAELLIENGADVKAKNNKGDTALIIATSCEKAKVLLDNGADVNAKNINGNTALMNSLKLRYNSRIIMEMMALLIKNGADINARYGKDASGDTVLDMANRYADVVWDMSGRKKYTAEDASLNMENRKKYTELADFLRKHGAKTSAELDKEAKKQN